MATEVVMMMMMMMMVMVMVMVMAMMRRRMAMMIFLSKEGVPWAGIHPNACPGVRVSWP